jgi:hypothetical protein
METEGYFRARRLVCLTVWALILSLGGVARCGSVTNTLVIDPSTNNAAATAELISALTSALTNPAPVVVNLFSNGVYTFTNAQNGEYGPNALPQIASDVTINGQGATLLGTNTSGRFFYVSGGLSYDTNSGLGLPAGSLTLNNLTLHGGLFDGGTGGGGGAAMGGAIFNQGNLSLTGVTLTGNLAQGGGGFGGSFLGVGGTGGAGISVSNTDTSAGGGGGGFRPVDNGQAAYAITNMYSRPVAQPGVGGGMGMLGGRGSSQPSTYLGDGGGGAYDFVNSQFGYPAGGAGGSYGQSGSANTDGGGGGIGGGGGYGSYSGGSGGFGGGGGEGYNNQGGNGGFGGGGGEGYMGGGGIGGWGGGRGGKDIKGYGFISGGGGGMGGAIFNHRGCVTLTNCTITGNTAAGGLAGYYYVSSQEFSGQGGSGYGGGIFNLNGSVNLVNCTVVSNSTIPGFDNPTNPPSGSADGGAIYSLAYGNRIEDGTESVASVTLANCILAGTITGTNDLVGNQVMGLQTNTSTITFLGKNLVMVKTNLSVATLQGSPTLTTNPLVGPLANNGGPTPTMALLSGSPAIDAGDNAYAPATDQRGQPRILGASVDLGAVETTGPPFITGFSSATGQFQLQFGGNSNLTYSIISSTDLNTPLTNWTCLGPATLVSNNFFQFTDTPPANGPFRYYRVRQP